MAGAAGPAIIFMMLLLAQVLIGTCVAAYAAHSFLTVVQDTAAGNDEVIWPDEPYYDWAWKPAYLTWLIAFWLVPTGLFLKVAKPEFLAESSFLRFVLLALIGLWLMFPISLLSSLTAQSRWIFFRPRMLLGLARFAPTVAAFYLVTLFLIGACAACFYLALIPGAAWMMPVAAVAGGAALLIYARLIGRLGWLLGTIKVDLPTPTDEAPPRKPPLPRKRRRPARAPEVHDPWKTPKTKKKWHDEEQPPTVVHSPEGIVEPYGMEGDEPLPPPKAEKHKVPFDGPAVPYGVTEEEPHTLPRETPLDGYAPVGGEDLPEPEATELPAPSVLDLRIGRRPRQHASPASPLVTGVYTFPWYERSMQAWLLLSLGLLLLQALYAFQQRFNQG